MTGSCRIQSDHSFFPRDQRIPCTTPRLIIRNRRSCSIDSIPELKKTEARLRQRNECESICVRVPRVPPLRSNHRIPQAQLCVHDATRPFRSRQRVCMALLTSTSLLRPCTISHFNHFSESYKTLLSQIFNVTSKT